MKLHHVGIVTLDPEKILTGLRVISPEIVLKDACRIDQWYCACYMYSGGVELIVPWSGNLLKWLREQGRRAIHHYAIEVPDVKAECKRLHDLGVPLVSQEPVRGVDGLLVNFVHPLYMGIMLELVQNDHDH